MLNISVEVEKFGSTNPLDFLVALRNWLREKQRTGEIEAYSMALATTTQTEATTYDLLEVIVKDEIAPKGDDIEET